jgi:4-hydroxy-tetrahydrodipicolinate synthase
MTPTVHGTGTARVTGFFAPVLTPLRSDLAPDATRLAQHTRWLLDQGAGLALFGTTSEANSLAVDERIELLDQLFADGDLLCAVFVMTGLDDVTDTAPSAGLQLADERSDT